MKKRLMLILICSLVFAFTACGTTENENSKNTTDEKTSNNSIAVDENSLITCPTFTAEKNTSSMVDQIAFTAKENASKLTDEQAAEIIEIIRNENPQFYDGPEEMEKFMWYGYLLDYKYEDSDPRSALGTDLCQTLKYVYRNVETVLDDATKENLNQIEKDLLSL